MKNQKMRTYALATSLAALLTMTVRQAHAVWVETQLTPQSTTTQHLSFSIKTKDADALKQFEVTVKPKADWKLSPVLTARLHIVDGETNIAVVPVEEKREGGKMTYWFRIAPKFLANSKFQFGEHGYGEVKDAQGNTQYVGLPGGTGYWFYLRDFANPENK